LHDEDTAVFAALLARRVVAAGATVFATEVDVAEPFTGLLRVRMNSSSSESLELRPFRVNFE
jgi:hypothetical protein